jgi:large subunit ribosomal protein L4
MAKKVIELSVVGSSKEVKTKELPAYIFDVKASTKLLAQYIHVYLANQKRFISTVKSRSDVKGSTRKIYKQKGTGRARHGDIKAPIFVGGGVAHGPGQQGKKKELPKKMRRKALFYTLSMKVKENNLKIVSDSLVNKVKKTKDANMLITKITEKKEFKNIILVLPHKDEVKKYFRNINNVNMIEANGMNAYFVMKSRAVYFSETALNEFISLFNKE